MFDLIYGASGSGKSAFAEQLITDLESKTRYYLAAMQPFGEDAKKRIARHRSLRAGKGFVTLETPLVSTLLQQELQPQSAALLECLSNLLANEMYDPAGSAENCVETILSGIDFLRAKTDHLVVVSNDLFADGEEYDPSTMLYLKRLASLNQILAAKADRVVEVVCGIPVWIKKNVP